MVWVYVFSVLVLGLFISYLGWDADQKRKEWRQKYWIDQQEEQ
jgi:hypothetical protein